MPRPAAAQQVKQHSVRRRHGERNVRPVACPTHAVGRYLMQARAMAATSS